MSTLHIAFLTLSSTVVMCMFYGYYRRYGTAKSAHIRSKEEYKADGDSLAKSEKLTSPENAHVPLSAQTQPATEQVSTPTHYTITNDRP